MTPAEIARAIKCGLENVDVMKIVSRFASGSGNRNTIFAYPWQIGITNLNGTGPRVDTFQLDTNQEIIALYATLHFTYYYQTLGNLSDYRSFLNNCLLRHKWEGTDLLPPVPRFPRAANPQYRNHTLWTLTTWSSIALSWESAPAVLDQHTFQSGCVFPIMRKIGPGGKLELGIDAGVSWFSNQSFVVDGELWCIQL